jgi:hypothetical protein
MALMVGGLSMTALFVPFTLTHGPTSYNEERELLGHDMLFWGLLLGVVPNVLIGAGFWTLRGRVAGTRRLASIACAAICIVLWMSAALDLFFGGLGPPFRILILAPTVLVACLSSKPTGPGPLRVRLLLGVLGAVLTFATVMALIPEERSDSFAGFRIFGLLAYATVGVLWALLGRMMKSARSPSWDGQRVSIS